MHRLEKRKSDTLAVLSLHGLGRVDRSKGTAFVGSAPNIFTSSEIQPITESDLSILCQA
jgi:hypothetical protein